MREAARSFSIFPELSKDSHGPCIKRTMTGTMCTTESERERTEGRRAALWLGLAAAVVLGGFLLRLWLASRATLYFDQVSLLRLGMRFALDGELSPVGKTMSGGFQIPGALLQLLVGLPLELWFDYRSPRTLYLLLQLAAGLLLWTVVGPAVNRRVAVVYLALYWLSPWALYLAGFLWEPGYLLLPAAAHLWACWRLRDEARFWPAVVLGWVLVGAPQLHASGVVLILLTLGLLTVKAVRVHWPGLFLGSAVGTLTLVPTVLTLMQGELPEAGGSEADLPGILKVYPVVKAALYWLRLGSLDVGRRLRQVELIPLGESDSMVLATDALFHLLLALSIASFFIALVAHWRFYQRGSGDGAGLPANPFWRRYVLLAFASLLVATMLSPVTVQGWHVLVVLHATTIPIAWWIVDVWRRAGAPLRVALVLFVVLRVPIGLFIGLGHPMYRGPISPSELEALEPENLPEIGDRPIPFGRTGADGEKSRP